jgi:hypothetical protein
MVWVVVTIATSTLEEAERAMLDLYVQRAGIVNGISCFAILPLYSHHLMVGWMNKCGVDDSQV